MKSYLKYLLFYILVVIFNSCASMGSPSGGETDNSPPYLLMDKVIPQQNININVNQQIKLVFNERIHPNSIKSSIRVEPSIEFEIKKGTDGKEVKVQIVDVEKEVEKSKAKVTIEKEMPQPV